MAAEFFSNFPVIDYDGIQLRNLILKSRIIADIIQRNELFHPLTIEDTERPDTVAYDYYGNSELYWLVLMSNNIIDPYYDWPLNQNEFRSYIMAKYGTVETAMQTVLYMKNDDPDINYYMSLDTHEILEADGDTDSLFGWNIPVYAYDVELEENEKKREIRLIDSGLVPQILQEIARIYG